MNVSVSIGIGLYRYSIGLYSINNMGECNISRLGRKKTIMICLLLLGAFGLGTAYAVNIYMYIVFHSLLALPVMGCYDSTATLSKYNYYTG